MAGNHYHDVLYSHDIHSKCHANPTISSKEMARIHNHAFTHSPPTLIQGTTEITPTFGGVTARAVEGIQWWEWSRWLAAVLPFSDDAMGWSGEHRGFVVETFFKNNESVITTQRAFRRHSGHLIWPRVNFFSGVTQKLRSMHVALELMNN